MGIIPAQVVEKDGDVLRELEIQIALVVCCAAIFPGKMVMVSNLIPSHFIPANVAVRAFCEALIVLVGHRYGLDLLVYLTYLPQFLFDALDEFLSQIFPAVNDRFLVVAVGILHAISET